MGNTLSTTSGSGLQTSTQSPQTATNSGYSAGAQTSAVQPSAATGLLDGQGGVPIQNQPVTTVNLGAAAAASVATPTAKPTSSHHVSGVGVGFIVVLVLIAVFATIYVTAGAKKTTNY